jgi:uncharacterized membrane protein
MSSVVKAALAAALSLAFVSGAMAQKQRQVSAAKAKPFTAVEKMHFDRASGASIGGGNGGDGGGGGDGGAGAI